MATYSRRFFRVALMVIVLAACAMLGPAEAMADGLGDFLWVSRPLLVFAPTDSDPRLAETMRRIEATRCDFVDRDMVLGVIVADGASSLVGRSVGSNQARMLMSQYGIGGNSFSVVLIGKDGGEKLRINGVPDMQSIYAVIDGMPMRQREMGAARC